jgi:hypothetical protein
MDDHPGNMRKDLLRNPLVFCKTPKGVRTQMSSGDCGPTNRAMSPQDRPCSRSSELFPVTLTDEQIMKAFDFTIILAEYGEYFFLAVVDVLVKCVKRLMNLLCCHVYVC